jgi:T4 RnlA family RNA ligase
MLPSGKIIAKSKTSIYSEQAIAANKIINTNKKLYTFIKKSLEEGNYPIFEYVGPSNRIVIPYKKEELILLSIRNKSFKYLPVNIIESKCKTNMVKFSKPIPITLEEVLKRKEQDRGYEGFVISLEDGEKIKCKLDTYVKLHYAKKEISNIKKIIALALDENLDDLRSLFSEEPEYLNRINTIEKLCFGFFHKTEREVFVQYKETKNLNRKDYAIFHKERNKNIFPLLMQAFVIGIEQANYKKHTLLHLQIEEKDL